MAILGGVGGLLQGGLGGAVLGVAGGISGADRSKREEEQFIEMLRKQRLENDATERVRDLGLRMFSELESGRKDPRAPQAPVEDPAAPTVVPVTAPVAAPAEEDSNAAMDAALLGIGVPAVQPAVQPAAQPVVKGGRRQLADGLLEIEGVRLPGGVEGLVNGIRFTEGTTDADARKHGYASPYDITLDHGKYMPKGMERAEISKMTLGEVQQLQKAMLAHPENKWNSSAVGAGQFVSQTLFGKTLKDGTVVPGLVQEMGLSPDTVFSPELQDQMMIRLLKRRGLDQFQAGALDLDAFRTNLGNEWSGTKREGDAVSNTGPTPRAEAPSYAAQVQRRMGPDPYGFSQMLPADRVEQATQARAMWESSMQRVRDQEALAAKDPVMAGFAQDELNSVDELEHFAKGMLYLGTPQMKDTAVGVLNGLNTRRQAVLGMQAATRTGNVEVMKSVERVYRDEMKAGQSEKLAVLKAGLAGRLKENELQIRHADRMIEGAASDDRKAALQQHRADLILQRDEIKAAEKNAEKVPEYRVNLQGQRKHVGDLYRARELASKIWSIQTGPIVGRLPTFDDDLQELEAILNRINASQVRTYFGGQPSVKESEIALYKMGPSDKQDLSVLKGLLDDVFRERVEQHDAFVSEIEPNFRFLDEPLPAVSAGSDYAKYQAWRTVGGGRKFFPGATAPDVKQTPTERRERARGAVAPVQTPRFGGSP